MSGAGATPFPETGTSFGFSSGSLEAIERVPDCAPEAVGQNCTVTGVEAPGATLKTAGDAVKSELRALDPTQPGHHVVTMEQLIARSVAADRFSIWLLGLLSALALLLAATGIYSVMAYAVEQRTHEIGVRLALGARLNDVLKLVVWQGLRIALVGVAIGLGGALVLTQWLKNMLYEVSATDPMTFAVVSLLLLGVAVLACWVPARRATQVDPLVALRHE